ncbi:HAD family hydrolase [bacterium]|nr:HAD family hydrolase [bacterium]
MAVIEWILFSVKGPLWNNVREIEYLENLLKEHLVEAGVSFTDRDFSEAKRAAMLAYGPDTLETMLWSLVKPDEQLYQRIIKSLQQLYRTLKPDKRRSLFNLNPGSLRVLHSLSRVYQLGLADNDFATARFLVEEAGLKAVFKLTDHFGRNPYAKPDVRFYEYLLQKTDAQPEKTVVVGSRLDLDILPALTAGLKTILVKRGPYAKLEPRNPSEFPHLEIDSIKVLPEAIKTLEI